MVEPQTKPAEPVFSLDKSELVALLVGPDEHELAVHESCITRNSEFFKAALKEEWSEGQTRVIKLPEESCLDTLRHYINFSYGQKLPTEQVTSTEEGSMEESYCVLSNIYVLGERVLDNTVQRAVIGEILRLSQLGDKDGTTFQPDAPSINIVFNGTTAESPARRLMVALYVAHGHGAWMNDNLHPAFVLDVSRSLLKLVAAGKGNEIRRLQGLAAERYLT